MLRRYLGGWALALALAAAAFPTWATSGQGREWIYVAPAAVLFTPAVGADGSVYFATADSQIRAVSPSGALQWAVNPGGLPSAAMALQGNILYFPTSQGELAAYGIDGHLSWRIPLHSSLSSTPAIAADGTLYIGTISGDLVSVAPNGYIRWSFHTGDPIVYSPVINHSGHIYVASTRNLFALGSDGQILAVTALKQVVSTPLAVDAEDNLYFVDASGSPWSRLPSGKKRWAGTGSATLTTEAASPVVGADSVVFNASFSTPPAHTYNISGTVTLAGGGALGGVSISATGTATATATTDANGSYTLTGMVDGTYTLTPQLTGYGFTPTTLSATVSGADVTGQDFSARPGYSISGTVTLNAGGGLQGVSITTFGATAITDANGAYTLDGLPLGTYTITPQLTGYTFVPSVLTVNLVIGSVIGEDFVATASTSAGSQAPPTSGGAQGTPEVVSSYQVGAYGLADGSPAWTPLDIGSTFDPALGADGTLYVSSTADQTIYLLDATTGSTLDTIKLPDAPGDLVLADTSLGPRLVFASGANRILCYGASAGPDPAAPWSEGGAGPRHLYRRDDPPAAALTSPSAGSVSGAVTVSANVSDDFPQSLMVRFLVDGVSLGTASGPPYSLIWYSQTSVDGTHIVSVEARDSAGNVAQDQVTVTSQNAGGTFTVFADTPPVPFSWTAPSDTRFRVEFATNPAFSALVASSTTAEHPWLAASAWRPSHEVWMRVLGTARGAGASPVTVYWRVVGKTSGTLAGAGGSFTIAGAIPPDGLVPADGSGVSPTHPPAFSWSAEHSGKFRAELSDTASFATLRLTSRTSARTWLKKASWTPSAKAWAKTAGKLSTLYWRVVGRDALGRETTSASNTLSVLP